MLRGLQRAPRVAALAGLPRGWMPAAAAGRAAARLASSTSGGGQPPLFTSKPPKAQQAAGSSTAPAPAPATSGTSSTLVPGVPDRAAAGLSPDYLSMWATKAAQGKTMPMIWENPGAYGQAARVPDKEAYALPPPPRPLWPISDAEFTWQYLRAMSFSLVLAALALYLHLKSRVKGAGRLDLERSYPTAARVLASVGLISDLSEVAEGLDRQSLWARVWARYAGEGAAATMPLPRAALLLAAVRGDLDTSALEAAASSSSSSSPLGALPLAGSLPAPLASALAGVAGKSTLTRADFLALASSSCADLSDAVLYLGAWEVLGVAAAPAPVLDAVLGLYAKVATSREAGASFTPAELAELASDAGFYGDAEEAADFLKDCSSSALTTGGRVALSSSQFADYLIAAAAAGQVAPARVPDYVRVFELLHLSGMREQAGVKSTASA